MRNVTGCKVSACVGHALFGVQHREKLKGVCRPGREIAKCIGYGISGYHARPWISGVAEALYPQAETRIIALGWRRPIYDRGFPIANRYGQIGGWIRC